MQQLAAGNLSTTTTATTTIGNWHERAAGARLLVMGAERVGKSAAIVRFTTGRFIHQYCPSTQDWLYRHQLMPRLSPRQDNLLEANNDENVPPPVLIELLEQKDLSPSGESDDQRQRKAVASRPNCSSSPSSLALRVASDQRADRELRECQQLMGKLNWANAYVIVYSLTSSDSFNKACEYLELLDWIYDGTNNRETSCQPDLVRRPPSIVSKISQRFASQPVARRHRPPILLLGNKHDLVVASNLPSASRQVTFEQAAELAARHQCLFAEVSISECANSIRNVLLELIGQVLPPPPSSSRPTFEQHSAPLGLTQPAVVTKWSQPSQQQQQPTWSSLIKTQMPLVCSSHSTTQVVGSVQEAHQQQQQQQPVAATCKALGPVVSMSPFSYAAPRQFATAQYAVAPRPLSTASLSSPPPTAAAAAAKQSSPTSASRYGALRSTFKKASLAIVSGKALASRVSGGRNSTGDAPSVTALKRNSTTSSNLSELLVSEQESSSFSVRGSLGSLSSTATTMATAALPPSSEAGPPPPPASSKASSGSKSTNWIKNRFSRQESSDSGGKSSSQSVGGPTNSGESQLPREQVASGGGRFKRPLFKYKNRLKTVAFEPSFGKSAANKTVEPVEQSNRTITTGSLDGASSGSESQYRERPQRVSETISPLSSNSSSSAQPANLNAYNTNRCSSGRSSSSLSTSGTYYSSLFIVCQAGDQAADRSPASVSSLSSCRHAPTPPSERNQRQDSHSTLSRASTSVGSYDEMLEEIESATSGECNRSPARSGVATPPVGKISPEKPPPPLPVVSAPPATVKTRFQVVKTVQSTLTNLAKSTRASVTPLQPVKRSFCSALMGTSLGLASPRVYQAAGAPIQQVAQIEPIRTIPAVVGYCK